VSGKVLRITNGMKKDKVRGSCRIANNEELTDFYRITDVEIVRRRELRWAEYVTGMGEQRKAYRNL
jgi:hypothetical protein